MLLNGVDESKMRKVKKKRMSQKILVLYSDVNYMKIQKMEKYLNI